MSDASDPTEEPASIVSATLSEQMLHLTNRFEEERLRLEERTFQTNGDTQDVIDD